MKAPGGAFGEVPGEYSGGALVGLVGEALGHLFDNFLRGVSWQHRVEVPGELLGDTWRYYWEGFWVAPGQVPWVLLVKPLGMLLRELLFPCPAHGCFGWYHY